MYMTCLFLVQNNSRAPLGLPKRVQTLGLGIGAFLIWLLLTSLSLSLLLPRPPPCPPLLLTHALATLERAHFLQHAFPLWAFATLFPRQPLPSCPAPSSPPNSPHFTVEFRCHLLHDALHDAPGRMSYSVCPRVFLWVFDSILPLLPTCFPGRIPISHKDVRMYFINPSWSLSSSLSSHLQ